MNILVMALTGLSAGILVPATAIAGAKLGICDPFSLEIAGRKWTFSRNSHVIAANTSVRFESSMVSERSYQAHKAKITAEKERERLLIEECHRRIDGTLAANGFEARIILYPRENK